MATTTKKLQRWFLQLSEKGPQMLFKYEAANGFKFEVWVDPAVIWVFAQILLLALREAEQIHIVA